MNTVAPKHISHGLLLNLKKTKSSRYEASRRLKVQHEDTTYLIVVLSIGVLLFSLAPYFFPESKPEKLKVLSFSAVVYSVFILVFSVMQDSKQRLVKSELFQRCSTELLDLRNRLKQFVSLSDDDNVDISNFIHEYTSILSKYPINHEDVDYAKTKLDMWSEIEGKGWESDLKKWATLLFYYWRVNYIKYYYLAAACVILIQFATIF